MHRTARITLSRGRIYRMGSRAEPAPTPLHRLSHSPTAPPATTLPALHPAQCRIFRPSRWRFNRHSPGRQPPLQPGTRSSRHGRSGWTPGQCGCAVISLLQRGGTVRQGIRLPRRQSSGSVCCPIAVEGRVRSVWDDSILVSATRAVPARDRIVASGFVHYVR